MVGTRGSDPLVREPPLRRPYSRRVELQHRGGRRSRDDHDDGRQRERHADVRRNGRSARQPEGERGHDRDVDDGKPQGLDHEAGRDGPRRRDEHGHERRLHRRQVSSHHGHVHDPRRPAASRHRVGHPAALRRPRRCERRDHARRSARHDRDHDSGPEREAHLRGHGRAAHQPEGERVTIGSTTGSLKVSITKPDGTALVAATSMGTSGGYIDVKSLPTTGTYTILVDPQ